MSPQLKHPLFLTLTLITLTTGGAIPPRTAHTELAIYGFPAGLLPANITSYTLNKTTGLFSINFRRGCQITLPPDNYLASYSPTVKGRIVHNKIGELDGIRVWAFFKWWSITGIKLSGNGNDNDDLVFEVGLASAKYSKSNFRVSPSCEGGKADS